MGYKEIEQNQDNQQNIKLNYPSIIFTTSDEKLKDAINLSKDKSLSNE